jgi:hypothetical protein
LRSARDAVIVVEPETLETPGGAPAFFVWSGVAPGLVQGRRGVEGGGSEGGASSGGTYEEMMGEGGSNKATAAPSEGDGRWSD